MPKYDLDSSDPLLRWLVQEAVVADLFKSAVDGIGRATRRPAESVSMRTLLACVWRDHDAPADIAIEHAVRTDPVTARRYINLLAGIAQASMPVVPERTIGKWHLKVWALPGHLSVLVLTQQDLAPAHAHECSSSSPASN